MNTHDTDEPSQRAVSELHLGRAWRPDAIRELVKQKTSAGRKPAFLFLGKHEAGLLREHLGTNFGPESVRSLRNLYYQGMEVIELDTPSFLRTAGMKRILNFRSDRGRTPRWKDLSHHSFWSLAL